MPENPLLPNQKLLDLYALMQRCRDLERKLPQRAAREAMLAAGAIHLLPGDVLCGARDDATVCALAPPPGTNVLASRKFVPVAENAATFQNLPLLALCAAMAGGLRAAGTGGFVLALAEGGATEAGWSEALAYAQRAQTPLIVLCGDATAGRAAKKADALSWPAIAKVAHKLKLPLLPVDGEDAVAVYRVMQECVGRARMGEGPAVIWCVLAPERTALASKEQPLARMRSYLAARGLSPISPKAPPQRRKSS